MKNLVLGSLLVFGASSATGCIITSDGGEDLATISADWSIQTISGSKATCPPNGQAMVLYNQLVDSRNVPIGTPDIDVFDCDLGHGVSDPLEPGVYQSWLEVTDCLDFEQCPAGHAVYAQSTSAIVDVTVSDKTFAATIFTDGGYFELDWELKGAQTNAPLECGQVAGLTAVEVLSTINGPGQSVTDKFMNCEAHHGVTAGMLQGSYTVGIEALMGNQSLGAAPTIPTKTIQAPNKVTDLGTIVIPIDGQ